MTETDGRRLGPLARSGLAVAPRLLRLLPPETAHALALRAIRLTPSLPLAVPPGLRINIAGLDLAHPLGLAAGFDKNAVALAGLLRLGFAFIEAGGVTLRSQPGNPRPRVFRLAEDGAIINRLGFNNDGVERFVTALARRPAHGPELGIVGANLGINKDSTDPSGDYGLVASRVLPLADFITVNVSSPNTKGLRDLQERRGLGHVLDAVMGARSAEQTTSGRRVPVFLKVAPDLDDMAALTIVDVAIERGVDALIVSNTTLARPAGLASGHRDETGGLSGRPLFAASTRLLGLMAGHAAGRIAFIGVGGIASGADAYAKIQNGATAVQLYTAFVYEGPAIIQRILDELAECLVRDGFKSVDAAVGSGL